MATTPVRLFFQQKKRPYGADADMGSIKFDLVLNERHNFNNAVSSHNIEDGSEISDHIRNELENGSLTGLISNFSVKTRLLRTNRAQDAFDFLFELWQAKALVTITTVMRVYRDMAITDISIPRSFDTGESAVFTISFRKVNQVKLKTVTLETTVKIADTKSDQNRQSSVTSDQGRTTAQ